PHTACHGPSTPFRAPNPNELPAKPPRTVRINLPYGVVVLAQTSPSERKRPARSSTAVAGCGCARGTQPRKQAVLSEMLLPPSYVLGAAKRRHNVLGGWRHRFLSPPWRPA
ncbi:MAG TPA: hypothetical protein VNO32_41040, partial [Candidatus Acidoferrum sp.]|nr:hypothetical protein [Candidatus Acidoferrum sp.]